MKQFLGPKTSENLVFKQIRRKLVFQETFGKANVAFESTCYMLGVNQRDFKRKF